MNNTHQKLLTSVVWLIAAVSFISLSLESFLFQIADYDIYRVLNISFSDFLILIAILIMQYLLLKSFSFRINTVWQITTTFKNGKVILFMITLLSGVIYSLIPSRFPFWIFFLLLGSLSLFYAFINYLFIATFHKVAFLLLFLASMNSSLVFWMHEEANEGRHVRYAQQLAERKDTIAENILIEMAALGKNIPSGKEKRGFWEKQWINDTYLASNYRMNVEENITDSSRTYFQPILTFDKALVPIYKIFFPEKYALTFKLNTDFRRSIYSPHHPFKNLKDLNDFHFSVIDRSKIVLSNSHAFDSNILDIELPAIGEGKKIELKGFDVLAYRHAEEVFVLIGEPLSEIQVWISNFAFFFSLLLGIAIFLEIVGVLILKKKIFNYWQELPIQFRIQVILIGITFLLFFIIATTTFLFLDQNNAAISHERQLYISETLRDEILQEEEQFGWGLEDFSVNFLAKLADRKQCDIDLYRPDGTIIVSSYATAENSPSPNFINEKIIHQIERNTALILVERQFSEKNKEPYLRTYFGIFHNDNLEGIVSISSFESEIGTSPYIPIVMEKLLNVYVFLLLIAWGGGLLLIGLLTKPLELLANRLSNFKLGEENEKLNWKGEDAIGQLISEYNKMVDKVEITTQELIRSEREGAWQIMAQQIAHEINNKLTPLKLNIQFLNRIVDRLNSKESEAIQQITKSLVEKIDGLSKIATQFKLFAKLDSPEVEPIEVKLFLEQFFNCYDQKEQFKYILNPELEKGHNPIINIDARHLQEVLNNIISNAENSIPEHQQGLIKVNLQAQDHDVRIEVEDNGHGIDAKLIENIFDPKFSVTSSQTGLGLPICKRIIEFYGGAFDFTTRKGIGTSFIITFPLFKAVNLEKDAS